MRYIIAAFIGAIVWDALSESSRRTANAIRNAAQYEAGRMHGHVESHRMLEEAEQKLGVQRKYVRRKR